MKIQIDQLHKALKAVRPALADKAIVESFVRFFFTGDHIITYNGRIMISYPFDTGDFSFSILAAPFFSFVSKTKIKQINLEIKKGNVKIKGKGLTAKIAVETNPELPEIEMPDSDSSDWNELPEGFIEGMKMCLISVGTDPSSEFSNVLFTEDGLIISSDDVRVSSYDTSDDGQEGFLIPGSSARELITFESESLSHYLVEENLVFFSTEDGAIFCSTRSADDFPDMLQYMEFSGSKYKLPKTVKTAVESSMVMNDAVEDIDKRIDVLIKDGKIKCKSEGDLGYIETSEKLKVGKKEIHFGINPIFFTHILEHSTIMTVGEGRALFKSGNFKHLVSLYEE